MAPSPPAQASTPAPGDTVPACHWSPPTYPGTFQFSRWSCPPCPGTCAGSHLPQDEERPSLCWAFKTPLRPDPRLPLQLRPLPSAHSALWDTSPPTAQSPPTSELLHMLFPQPESASYSTLYGLQGQSALQTEQPPAPRPGAPAPALCACPERGHLAVAAPGPMLAPEG